MPSQVYLPVPSVTQKHTSSRSESNSPPNPSPASQANLCENQDPDLLANEELQTIQVALRGGRHRRGNLSQSDFESFHMFRRDVRSGSIPDLAAL
jgi:hypothetical protein